MTDGVFYVHVFGRRLAMPLSFSPHNLDQRVCDHNHEVNGRDGNKGGYTLRVDSNNHTIAISLCSFKDHFSRRRGREVTDERSERGPYKEPAVIAPRLRMDTKGPVFDLSRVALQHAFRIWLQSGWSVAEMTIAFVNSPKAMKASEERVDHHPV